MSIELNAKWPVQYYSLSSFFLLRIVFLTFRFIPLSPFIYFSPLPMIAPPRIPLLHLDGCNSICSARETYRAGTGITVPSCKKEKLLFRSNSKHSLSLSRHLDDNIPSVDRCGWRSARLLFTAKTAEK